MLKQFKKNFEMQSLLERAICVLMSVIAAFWLFHGEVFAASLMILFALVEPKWFAD